MEVCRYLTRCLTFRTTNTLCHPLVRPVSPLSFRKSFTSQSLVSGQPIIDKSSELFEYTSGRWICNDAQQLSERRRVFNVSEFKRLAAASINQNEEDVTGFEKFTEGFLNRAFLVTMRDGFQLVARIPYPLVQPKHLVIASEVATMDFLRLQGIPVPKVYGYSAVADNAAGTEYIFMELIRGMNLGDTWDDMPGKDRNTVITKLVELESRLFALRFPASGSLYYTKDLQAEIDRVIIPTRYPESQSQFCIGPDTAIELWYGKRLDLQVDRGPYRDATAALTAGAKKEVAYLTKFGQPRHPLERLRRKIYDYEKQSHFEHMELLEKYLQIAPHLIPTGNSALASPTIRHINLKPQNIFVSDSLEITGVVGWQYCNVLPLFLQHAIPKHLIIQSYDDQLSVSEWSQTPQFPDGDLDELSEGELLGQFESFRRRQLQYFYITATAKLNPMHYDALTRCVSADASKEASYPWMGDSVDLKISLIGLVKNWSKIADLASSTTNGARLTCPIAFSEDEVNDCLERHNKQGILDWYMRFYERSIGVDDGIVSPAQYEKAKQREQKLKADILKLADPDEYDEYKKLISEYWIFDDFDLEEYK